MKMNLLFWEVTQPARTSRFESADSESTHLCSQAPTVMPASFMRQASLPLDCVWNRPRPFRKNRVPAGTETGSELGTETSN